MNKLQFGKIKRRLTKHKYMVRILLASLAVFLFVVSLYFTIPPVFRVFKTIIRGPVTAFSLVKDPKEVLRSYKDRTNILLLGIGGGNHEGSQLTDSIILVSVDLLSADVVMLSIPRDIWVDSMKTKVNAVYYYGEQKKTGGGLVLAKAAVEEIVGQPVHYALILNFDGFQHAIDLVGGIEVDVPENFDDYKYPIPGMENAEPEELRYEHLHFNSGLQKMNGEITLKYVRSRNAEGNQGTDYARSRRQQQVMVAFKDQLLSLETIISPIKVKELARTFSDSMITDLAENEYLSLIKLAIKSRNQTIRHGSLNVENEQPEGGLLINPPASKYEGQWVLIDKAGDWSDVHSYVEELFYTNK